MIGVRLMVSNLQNENLSSSTEYMEAIPLHYCFQLFENQFCNKFIQASKEFLGTDFNFNLVGVSYESNFLWRENDYFVTQINFSKDFFLVQKISDVAVNLIFFDALGTRQEQTNSLKLKDMTEFEAHILTAYNEFIHTHLSGLFLDIKEINSIIHTVKDEKTVYLTFYVSGNSEQEAGQIILSFPQFILKKLEPLSLPKHLLKIDFFNNSLVEINILIGSTSAALKDIKNLEPEDIIILEKSNIHTMHLKEFQDISINVNPNPSLIIDFDNEENGDIDIVNEVKGKNKDIWDSLEVDVNASFEKIKVKLGDLREITEGLVIDIAPIANNKVFIDVEGRQLATGDLVIIGDKYGIKITEIFADAKSQEVEKIEESAVVHYQESEQDEQQKEIKEPDEIEETDDEDENIEIDEDLDESDFEIEEEED